MANQGFVGSVFLAIFFISQGQQASANSETLYLKCVKSEMRRDNKVFKLAYPGYYEMFRVTGNHVDDWIKLHHIFVDNCTRLSLQCKTRNQPAFIHHERVSPSSNYIKQVFYIDRFTGDYSGWTEFPGDEAPYSTFKGTCSKVQSPELRQRAF
jgi:hypothetical protein